jgi:nucleotide-binding universal stress UspA family protein
MRSAGADKEGSVVFRRVLVGYDGSDDSAHALRVALGLAEGLQAEVVALSAIHVAPNLEVAEDRERQIASSREIATRGFDAYREHASQHGVELHHIFVEQSDPATALSSYAEEHAFDLLVVGLHGRDQTSHLGVGRALEKLLRSRSCPLLVV